jgi:hypothetical protein
VNERRDGKMNCTLRYKYASLNKDAPKQDRSIGARCADEYEGYCDSVVQDCTYVPVAKTEKNGKGCQF